MDSIDAYTYVTAYPNTFASASNNTFVVREQSRLQYSVERKLKSQSHYGSGDPYHRQQHQHAFLPWEICIENTIASESLSE
jgi:myosin-crossreactive antigen